MGTSDWSIRAVSGGQEILGEIQPGNKSHRNQHVSLQYFVTCLCRCFLSIAALSLSLSTVSQRVDMTLMLRNQEAALKLPFSPQKWFGMEGIMDRGDRIIQVGKDL